MLLLLTLFLLLGRMCLCSCRLDQIIAVAICCIVSSPSWSPSEEERRKSKKYSQKMTVPQRADFLNNG